MRYDVVIVGAGHGGAQAAIALRQARFAGTIAMIGDEPELPYERPPLSKEYLKGDKTFDRMLIRPAAFWQERDVSMLLGQRVVSVDPIGHRVKTADGAAIEYGRLIWAAGGSPRKLTCGGNDLAGVHTVRTRADVDQMISELPGSGKAVILGGGYIGLEAAAALSALGKHVVIVEALDRVLSRVAGEPLSRFFEGEHRAHGVDIRLNAAVACVEGTDRVTGVRLNDGELIPADMVIVGIGIVPSVDPLIAAGVEGGDGIAVDTQCRTSLPDIYAIGDCARHSNSYADYLQIRLESVQNANDQANIVARTISGDDARYDAIPWFWSNQYDLRLQTIGLSIGHDTAVTRGDPETRSFSVIYLRRGQVIALDCVNATKDFVQGRRLIVEKLLPSVSELADTAMPLKVIEATQHS